MIKISIVALTNLYLFPSVNSNLKILVVMGGSISVTNSTKVNLNIALIDTGILVWKWRNMVQPGETVRFWTGMNVSPSLAVEAVVDDEANKWSRYSKLNYFIALIYIIIVWLMALAAHMAVTFLPGMGEFPSFIGVAVMSLVPIAAWVGIKMANPIWTGRRLHGLIIARLHNVRGWKTTHLEVKLFESDLTITRVPEVECDSVNTSSICAEKSMELTI